MFNLNPRPNRKTGIDLAAYLVAAKTLDVPVVRVRAVDDVESAGSGFLGSGRPKILFEGHIFHRLTGGKFSKNYPTVSYPEWTKQHYLGKEAEYKRLELAMRLDARAALRSASWGRFQILGDNFAACGYGSVESFVEAMFLNEANHLTAFVNYVKFRRLDDELRRGDMAAFARGYNGPDYKRNHYDTKLVNAERRFSTIHPLSGSSLDNRYLVSPPVEAEPAEADDRSQSPTATPATDPSTVSSETSTTTSPLADQAGASANPEGAATQGPALEETFDGAVTKLTKIQDKIDVVNNVVGRVNGSTKSLFAIVWGHVVQFFLGALAFFAMLPLKVWAIAAVIFAAMIVAYIYRQTILDKVRYLTSNEEGPANQRSESPTTSNP